MEILVDVVYQKELKSYLDKKKSYEIKLKIADANLKPPVLVDREDVLRKIKIEDISKLSQVLELDQFVIQTNILTILSILLEVFGHLFISLGASFGYMIYRMNAKFIVLGIHFT